MIGKSGSSGVDSIRRIAEKLGDREFVVVSNRQPYSHEYSIDDEYETEGAEITVEPAVGGLTAALDPVMSAVGGTWVAWGDGDADRDVAPDGHVAVPPDDPAYDLQRVWLDEEAVDGYYYGYSNRALWPLCHSDVARATFDIHEWEQYRRVNETFADAAVDAVEGDSPLVWFHDYHLALAPRMAKSRLPDKATVAGFWHIPWPSVDIFRTCPQAEMLLSGLLGCDLIGFHTQRYCEQFFDCAEQILDVSVDRATGRVRHPGGTTTVRPFPLGTDAERQRTLSDSEDAAMFWQSFEREYGLEDVRVAVGVDRLDYTKGLVERLDGIERFLETHPEWHGRFTYVGKLSESRMRIPAYRRYRDQVKARIESINDRFAIDDWQPIIPLSDRLSSSELAGLYRGADLALVTPVRDGMNLVAKEYVAASNDGVLVLSDLAGSHEELDGGAITINPNDTSSVSDAIACSLTMPASERQRRLATLQQTVHSHQVYDWLEDILGTARIVGTDRAQPELGQPTAD